MKRLLAIALAGAMILPVAGCGSGGSSTSTASSEPAATEAPQEEATEAAAEEPAEESADESGALSGTLEVWSSGEELGRFVEGFNKVYPDDVLNAYPELTVE